MIDYAKEHAKELRRREPLQQRPEFLDWLGGMEDGLNDFFTRVVPDMPTDPYTAEGLNHAEQAALQYFPTSKAASPSSTPENAKIIDRFHRYLGETLVRRLDGTWLYIDMSADRGPEPVVEVPFGGAYHDPRGTLISAMRRRTGNRWVTMLKRLQAEHDDWVAAGRPAPPDWLKSRWS